LNRQLPDRSAGVAAASPGRAARGSALVFVGGHLDLASSEGVVVRVLIDRSRTGLSTLVEHMPEKGVKSTERLLAAAAVRTLSRKAPPGKICLSLTSRAVASAATGTPLPNRTCPTRGSSRRSAVSTTAEPPPDDAAGPTVTEGPTSHGVTPSEASGNEPGSQVAGGIDSDVTAQRTQPNVRDDSAPGPRPRAFALTGAEQFWYILHCIWFGAGYFAKIPTKKALSDAGLVEMTSWERIWYVLQCIAFGSGYFAKVPVKKALSEAGLVERTGAEQFWYVLQCIAFGSGYFAKVPTKKALSDIRLARMTDVSQFWYVVQCIAFGAGYFAKVIHKKALSEMPRLP
jgi:hypothetical protein